MNNISEIVEYSPEEEKRARERGCCQQTEHRYYPLTHGQQALWFLYQIDPESPAYNSNFVASHYSRLDIHKMRQAFSVLVERHAVVKTRFTLIDAKPVQYICADVSPLFCEIDASTWSESFLRARVEQEAYRPFNLEEGPVLRATIFIRSPEEQVLVLSCHHILSDFRSMMLLLHEMCLLYAAEQDTWSEILPPAGSTYRDYEEQQQSMLLSQEGQAHWEYWKNQFSSGLTPLDLPADLPRVTNRRSGGNVHAFTLQKQVTRDLKALARSEKVTPYVILLAAFQILLAYYTNQTDIAVGSFVHGRNSARFYHTFGYFINPIILRSVIKQEQTFTSLLAQVRRTVHEARKHGDYPLSLIVKQLQLTREQDSPQPFQAAFNMTRTYNLDCEGASRLVMGQEGGTLRLSGLEWKSFAIGQAWSQFDLNFTAEDGNDTFYLYFEYSTDLYSAEMIEQMSRHLQMLLTSAIAHPAWPLWQHERLTGTERKLILSTWNETETGDPEHLCLHQHFEQQVLRTPQNIAAVFQGEELTYAALESRANQLAHHLQSLGVGPDVPVGIYLDRSLELIVALLAVLKAGGAYLPLDTQTPLLRTQQLLEDAGVAVCLSSRHTSRQFQAEKTLSVSVDDWSSFSRYPATPPRVAVMPEHLVSFYYTSGSTGQPKGVCSTHKGWVNRMLWMQQCYQLKAGEAVLQKTTLTFDDSAVEIFWPLMIGARIALLEPELHKDPQAILEAARQYQVALLQFVPSMLSLFVEALTPEDRQHLSSLRHVISSGEALRSELVRLFQDRLDCELHNQWGATEVSIDSTMHTCQPVDAVAGAIVPVGRPLANNRVYILNASLQPVPIGVPGDLYLAGAGLARGYLNDSGRSAEVFLPDPFEPGARMYKTGDQGRYRQDGTICFLGRSDEQVKVRGQRIELVEIEAVLARHPAVKNCAVLADRRSGEYRLVAYVVPRTLPETTEIEPAFEPGSLRHFMSERLPDYMVPGRFLSRESLPINASGKLDRKCLPLPDDERPELLQTYVAPVTPVEQAIALIWQQVLGLKQAGLHDRFFELGGHSLDATRIIARINQEFKVHIPLRTLFASPTIAELARQVDQLLVSEKDEQQELSITHLPPQEHYELSHAQQRIWFRYRFDEKNAYGAILALEIEGALERGRFERALNRLVNRHSILRTTFTEQDGIPQQIVHTTIALPFHYADLTYNSSQEQAALMTRRAIGQKQQPFDLLQEPAFRIHLYKLAEQRYRSVWSFHPIIFDGWSLSILMNDLQQALSLACQKNPADEGLPPVLQYTDYASWQNRNLAIGAFKQQQAYWLHHLAQEVRIPQLPYDFERAEHLPMTSRFATLESALTTKLYALSQAHGATLYMTLLAGLTMWLANITSQTMITVGSPISGRNRTELEGVFGVMWNPVALRTDLSGNPSYRQALAQVQQTTLEVFANQDYPFDLVIQDLRRIHGKHPALYSVVFVVQNASAQTATSSDFTLNASFDERLLEEGDPNAEGIGDDLTIQYDLHIEAIEQDEQILLMTQYNPGRFLAATVDGFLEQFLSALEQFVADPDTRLSQLELPYTHNIDDLF